MSTPDFFRARLDGMIDLNHPLAILGRRIPWGELERTLEPLLAHRDRPGVSRADVDLFGTSEQLVGAGVSVAGRPRLPVRLMVALLYLKHAYNESDESVVQRWSQDVYFQYFSGQEYFEARLPCDATQIGRFRKLLGEQGVEHLLATTIATAQALGVLKRDEFERIIVDSTVQEKAIAHPTDSRLLEVARAKAASMAKAHGIELKQTYEREARVLRRRAGGYAHARQFRRLRGVLKRQRTILGRLLRDIERKLADQDHPNHPMRQCLAKAWRLHRQQPKGKNKLYAWHAPEAECIAKGKARRPYEFGVKASIAVTARSGLIVGARTFPGNPYDGHCLAAQIEQSTILLQDIAENPIQTVIADLGYRGVDHEIAPVQLVHRGKRKRLGEKAKRWLRRRQAIEPVIGHLKADHRMDRCWLKGAEGDAIHTVLCAAGFNLGWLLRAIAERLRRGRFFVANFWLLIQALSRALLAGYRRLRSQLVLHPPPAGT